MMARSYLSSSVRTVLLAGAAGRLRWRSAIPTSSSPTPARAEGASASEVDSLWSSAQDSGPPRRSGVTRSSSSSGRCWSSPRAIRARPQAHYYLGEAHFALGSHLEAAREFRQVSDETPNDPLAPEALLRVGDVYADLWRRRSSIPPTGRRRSPPTRSCSTAIRAAAGGQAGPGADHRAAGALRLQGVQGRALLLPAQGLRLGHPLPEGPGRHLSPGADRAGGAGEAGAGLREAGLPEDVKETCGYIRRFHPKAPGQQQVCPPDTTGAS